MCLDIRRFFRIFWKIEGYCPAQGNMAFDTVSKEVRCIPLSPQVSKQLRRCINEDVLVSAGAILEDISVSLHFTKYERIA